jgi:hypothetical protein
MHQARPQVGVDVRVRRALAHALHRLAGQQVKAHGLAMPSWTIPPPGIPSAT